jgi:hypothetical protein
MKSVKPSNYPPSFSIFSDNVSASIKSRPHSILANKGISILVSIETVYERLGFAL